MIIEQSSLTALTADIGLALTTTDDLGEMLRRCTDVIVQHLDAAFARIWELDYAKETLVLKASSGIYTHLNGPHSRVPVGQFKIGLIAKEKKAHLTNDVLNDPRVSDRAWAKREGMVSFAGYPLLVQNQTVGVIALFSRNFLSYDVLQAMAAVSQGIALGIKRKQTELELRTLNHHLEQTVADRTMELRKREAELYQTRKMEAVGRLAGGVAHDFNNLLTGILGCSEFLEEKITNPELQVEVAEIKKAAERASGLTRQLLAFSRRQILTLRPVDLNHLVSDTSNLLRRLVGEDITLNINLDPSVPKIIADQGQLEQVVMNIVLNGRDAMPRGGQLYIETTVATMDKDNPQVDTSAGDYIMLSISDTGTGMSKEVQSRIFEPFFTTKDPGKGTGLGLATAHGIVKQMGGTILVYSQEEIGTTFKILLPQAGEESGSTPSSDIKPSESEFSGGTETILVVEDEELVASHISRLLGRKGYDVLVAHNPKEALRIFNEHPKIDLIITDVVMPEMNGKELVARIHAIQPAMKVLFMSGYPREIISQKGILDPGISFIPKPFHSAAFCQRVRGILDLRA